GVVLELPARGPRRGVVARPRLGHELGRAGWLPRGMIRSVVNDDVGAVRVLVEAVGVVVPADGQCPVGIQIGVGEGRSTLVSDAAFAQSRNQQLCVVLFEPKGSARTAW